MKKENKMKTNNAFCSVCTVNYSAYAATLNDSLRKVGHDEPHYVLLVDYDSKYKEIIEKFNFTPIFLEQLGIPKIDELIKKYSAFELCNALRPFFIEWLLKSKEEIETLVYLDTDIYVYCLLGDVFEYLKNNKEISVLITPHIKDYDTYARSPGYVLETLYMKSGLYNSGFSVYKNEPRTFQFLGWLKNKLFDYCYNAPNSYMFVDQKILDFAPVLFDFVHIYKSKTYNIGHWNLNEQPLLYKDNSYFMGNEKLVFFHFSFLKIDEENDGNSLLFNIYLNDKPTLKKISYEYWDNLKKNDYKKIVNLPYFFEKKREVSVVSNSVAVTIVVPIYKDIVSLRNCILSLKDNVDKKHKILLVNDRSSDFREIESEVLKLIEGDSRFQYYLNDSNIGFVKTCNRAVYELDETDNEILLLNSDTIVTANFLEELIDTMYINEKHGVVCPRSNNASILTIPFNCLGDKNITIDKSYSCYLKIRDLLPKYSVIPTGVGFCMLIRRNLISNYGLFDELYSPGYNEENDFSMRINRYGYSSVMANYSYVFHCESKSFSKEQKAELNKLNLQKLLNRYPYYLDLVSKYSNYQINPIEYFAEFIDDSFFKKKRILFSLLDLQPVHNGSAEYGLNMLKYFVANFSDKYEIDILTNPSADKYHEISKKYANVFFESNLTKHYHLAILPSQFFDINHLLLLNRVSLKIMFSLLDIIALRCGYLSSQSLFLENLSVMALMYVDGIVSISDYTKKDTLSYFSEKVIGEYGNKIRVIPLGLNSKEVSVKTEGKNMPFKKYVLIVGNQHFDHKSVRETITQLLKTDIKFCVIGCKDYIQNDKYIGYPSGNLSDEHVDELFRCSDLLVFPSVYEGFGLPILKGLKLSKKIVLLDSEVNHEIASMYGKDNFIFYKKNNDLEKAIRFGIKKEFVKMVDIKTWKEVALETEKFVEEIINKNTDPVVLQKRWFSLMTIEQKIKDTRLKDLMITELRGQLHSTFSEYGLVKARKIYKILDVLSRNRFFLGIYRIIKNNKKYIWRK